MKFISRTRIQNASSSLKSRKDEPGDEVQPLDIADVRARDPVGSKNPSQLFLPTRIFEVRVVRERPRSVLPDGALEILVARGRGDKTVVAVRAVGLRSSCEGFPRAAEESCRHPVKNLIPNFL